jgi:hypothetical protein
MIKLIKARRQVYLGDALERIAKPIARVMRLPCLDQNGKLRPESGCAKRRAALNAIDHRVRDSLGIR